MEERKPVRASNSLNAKPILMDVRFSVFGGGAWGTSLANALAIKHKEVILYIRNKELANSINHHKINQTYLPDIKLEDNILATSDLHTASQSDIWLLVIPCQELRKFCQQLKQFNYRNKKIVICCKGIEHDSLSLPLEIVNEELPHTELFVLSGPNFAHEIAKFIPSATVIAGLNYEETQKLAVQIGHSTLRVYFSTDIIGVQVGGAAKNVIAIACGIAKAMNLGQNTLAALITRGLAEIVNLAVAKGAEAKTLRGLAGIGDLVLTCSNSESRNFRFGYQIGQGEDIKSVLNNFPTVEGYHSAQSIKKLAQKLKINMPITETVYAILYEKASMDEAINSLLMRPLTIE